VTSRRDADFADYVAARMPSLRRLAVLLCHDWHRADDLVQAGITTLYVHWTKARAADNIDAYVRTILVREFLRERRTGWARRVTVSADVPEFAVAAVDQEGRLDLRRAVAALPPRQRAALVLRFYCDLTVEQSAEALGCTPGTVKSQTAKALDNLRRAMSAQPGSAPGNPAPGGLMVGGPVVGGPVVGGPVVGGPVAGASATSGSPEGRRHA
jgi:RNA polymerase sigma-70 factor (sigma-E family)